MAGDVVVGVNGYCSCCLALQLVFDYKPGDRYCCVADIGWITGHSYVVYGPLSNAATTVLFESTPEYPDPGEESFLYLYLSLSTYFVILYY